MICISVVFAVVWWLAVCLSRSCIVLKRLKIRPQLLWNAYRKPYSSFRMVAFSMTLNDLEWLSKIFKDTKHHVASLRQLSFLFSFYRAATHRQTNKQTDRQERKTYPRRVQQLSWHLLITPDGLHLALHANWISTVAALGQKLLWALFLIRLISPATREF